MNAIQSIIVDQFCIQLELSSAQEQLQIMKTLLERYDNGERDYLCTNLESLTSVCSKLQPVTLAIVVMNVMHRDLFDIVMNSKDFRDMMRTKFEDQDELPDGYRNKRVGRVVKK